MTYRYVSMLGAALFMSFPPGCHAGPCSEQIAEMEAKIYTRLNAQTPQGPQGQETSRSDEALPNVSTKTVEAAGDAMDHAREADLAGDKAGCERALAEARKILEKIADK